MAVACDVLSDRGAACSLLPRASHCVWGGRAIIFVGSQSGTHGHGWSSCWDVVEEAEIADVQASLDEGGVGGVGGGGGGRCCCVAAVPRSVTTAHSVARTGRGNMRDNKRIGNSRITSHTLPAPTSWAAMLNNQWTQCCWDGALTWYRP